MNLFLRIVKIIVVMGLIALYCAASIILSLIIPNKWKLAKYRAQALSFSSSAGLWVLGVKVKSDGLTASKRASLVVSNHLSYLDILILASRVPACFVTSMEIRESQVLGPLARIGGCLFVERRSRQFLDQEINEITSALKNNVTVVVFPEATSTDGSQVLRFRQPLYRSAILAGCSITPVCLNYEKIDDALIDNSNRDKVFWYGKMSFFPHLWELTRANRIEVRMSILTELQPTRNHGVDYLAQTTHQLVSEHFQPCQSI